MSSDPLHLLLLPREIRNQIYSYLHKEVEFPLRDLGERCPAQLRVQNMPFPQMLRVHSQLYHEYREDCWFKKHLTASLPLYDPHRKYELAGTIPNKEAIALSQISRLTIPVHRRLDLHVHKLLERYIQDTMPNLSIIRLLTGDMGGPLTEVPSTSQELFSVRDGRIKVPIVQDFCLLPLIQKINCEFIQTKKVGEQKKYCYVRYTIGCTYSANSPSQLVWTPQDVLKYTIPIRWLAPPPGPRAEEEERSTILITPPAVQGWQETRFNITTC